jgi:DNA polymerase alpha subunit A
MTEMCESYLKIDREDIDPEDIAGFFDDIRSTSTHLLRFVQHCEADTYFQMAILHKVQALLLTRQLTNLAGNRW